MGFHSALYLCFLLFVRKCAIVFKIKQATQKIVDDQLASLRYCKVLKLTWSNVYIIIAFTCSGIRNPISCLSWLEITSAPRQYINAVDSHKNGSYKLTADRQTEEK